MPHEKYSDYNSSGKSKGNPFHPMLWNFSFGMGKELRNIRFLEYLFLFLFALIMS